MHQKSHLIGFLGCITQQIKFHQTKKKKIFMAKTTPKIIKLEVKKPINQIKL